MFQHTDHSAWRSSQRGLTDEEIEYVSLYASRYHRAGAFIYYLRLRDVPPSDRCRDWAARLVGTALVVSRDGSALLTIWRNRRNGLKQIRKKEARRSTPVPVCVEDFLPCWQD